MREQDRQRVLDLVRLANDRARLQFALQTTLKALGLHEVHIDKIVQDVRACDFDSLHKTLKLPLRSTN